MKTLKNLVKLILIPTIGLSACKTIEEGVIYKTTKEYVGKLESSKTFSTKWPKPKKTFIVTDSISFTVRGEPEIKPGTRCSVTHGRIKDPSGKIHSATYFTWSGNKTEKKFMVYRRGRHY